MPAPGRSRHLVVLAAALALAGAGAAIESAGLFQRLRFAVQRDLRQLPSTQAVEPETVFRGLPTLSIYFQPQDLQALLENKREHGRAWERRASVSYFNEGRLQFGGEAGVRVHGGGSRITSPRQGWRIFFRRQYGTLKVPRGAIFGPHTDPLKRLVVHNDVRTDADGTQWHLVNPLAYDLARRIGCITPETLPARFVLNGEDQGLFVLTEHFDDEYFDAHMPGHRVTMEIEDMEALRDTIDATRPLTMEAVSELLDLDNVTSWFLAVVFAATRDAYQGPGQFLDEDRDRAGWFWITWDLDQSFRNWDLDSFLYILERVGEPPRGRRASEPRGVVLSTLIAEDQNFREYLARRIDTMLNHQLTPEFLEERRSHYADIAANFGVPTRYLELEREFLARRPAFVRAIAEQWLNTGPGVPVSIERPDGGRLIVDGFEKGDSFAGTYFPGREVVVQSPGARLRWLVNGAPVAEGEELRLEADRPLAVIALAGNAAPPPPAARSPVPEAKAPPLVAAPLEWRQIPPGAVMVGCSETDRQCEANETPRQEVVLRSGFELTATEVTIEQYAAFAHASGQTLPRQPLWSGQGHPVVNITYNEAVAFCEASGGRLPTEIEWEYAARGGRGQTAFTTGPRLDREAVNGKGVGGRDQWGMTAPVGSFPPGAFGLFDMTGNVWEWTSTWYRADAAWAEPRQEAPTSSSPDYLKTVRGGSWDNTTVNLRVSKRVGLSPRGRQNLYVGIRCAR
ncbi:MAG TPA: SUMF1/EgtB/PvdO family nonheme iron enzyme [Vicinamibacterales bacterium]|nr:SUMF1/EgtB/PvdO family nonheme iron enzyme [Vicinamibacterales bacterium]